MGEPEQVDRSMCAHIELKALEFGRAAGQLALEFVRTPPEIEYKDDKRSDPVTAADRAVEALLHEAIQREFPDHGILGEEGSSEESNSDFVWVLDPIDGTTNFIRRMPFFSISIGVLHRLRPLAGCIVLPSGYGGEPALYHASRDGGAFLGDQRLHVALDPRPGPTRLAALPGGFNGLYRQSRAYRRSRSDSRVLGSIAAEMALVAHGSLHFAIYAGPKIWDVVAGLILIQEAGGTAIVHRRGRLRALDQLIPPPGVSPLEALRRWREPLVCGNPELAQFVAENVRLSPPMTWKLRRLWRKLRSNSR